MLNAPSLLRFFAVTLVTSPLLDQAKIEWVTQELALPRENQRLL
jgi:hypothetical protein